MTHLRRLNRQPGTYFVTFNTWERRPLFRKKEPARVFFECLFHYRNESNFLLHEFVLMPDHFHLLLMPASSITLERALQLIKGGSSHRIRKELSYHFPVWQAGFDDRRIRSVNDFQQRQAYIHQNPVEKGIVSRPEDYPFSSLHREWKPRLSAWDPSMTSAAKAAAGGEPVSAGLKPGLDRGTTEISRVETRPRHHSP